MPRFRNAWPVITSERPRMVDISGVYEVDAVVERRAHELVDRRLLQLADGSPKPVARAERHASEAQLGYEQAGIAEFLQSHAIAPLRGGSARSKQQTSP